MLAISFVTILAWVGGLTLSAGLGMGTWLIYKAWKTRDDLEPNFGEDAVEIIVLERHRQVFEEGFTTDRDDRYKKDELAIAAACYLYAPKYPYNVAVGHKAPIGWPLAEYAWKPATGRMKQLQKAGGLVLAEIERELRKQHRDRVVRDSKPTLAAIKSMNDGTAKRNTP